MTTAMRPGGDRSPDETRQEIQREFSELTASVRRVVAGLKVAADPLDRVRLASELRNVQLEIDAFVKRHDTRLSVPTRKYLDEASLQIEIRLTAMAANAARRARLRTRRPLAAAVNPRPSPGKIWHRPGMPRRSGS